MQNTSGWVRLTKILWMKVFILMTKFKLSCCVHLTLFFKREFAWEQTCNIDDWLEVLTGTTFTCLGNSSEWCLLGRPCRSWLPVSNIFSISALRVISHEYLCYHPRLVLRLSVRYLLDLELRLVFMRLNGNFDILIGSCCPWSRTWFSLDIALPRFSDI